MQRVAGGCRAARAPVGACRAPRRRPAAVAAPEAPTAHPAQPKDQRVLPVDLVRQRLLPPLRGTRHLQRHRRSSVSNVVEAPPDVAKVANSAPTPSAALTATAPAEAKPSAAPSSDAPANAKPNSSRTAPAIKPSAALRAAAAASPSATVTISAPPSATVTISPPSGAEPLATVTVTAPADAKPSAAVTVTPADTKPSAAAKPSATSAAVKDVASKRSAIPGGDATAASKPSSSGAGEGTKSNAPNGAHVTLPTAAEQGQQPPVLAQLWKDMGDGERRNYLEAVRDYYGEGVVCERVLRSGRKVLALVDTRMQAAWEEAQWRATGRGGALVAERGNPDGGRAHLAEWTARQCVIGAIGAGSGLRVASWTHRDGCPANCLPRNLELRLESAAPGEAAATRLAKLAARAAVQRLYGELGPHGARRYLASLHRELSSAADEE